MKKFLTNLLVSGMLTLARYLPTPDQGFTEVTQGEEEPQKEMDEWTRMMNHDSVTLKEEKMLCSDDPEKIMQAQQQIHLRELEFNAWWEDTEARRRDFYGDLLQGEVSQTPMDQREGWEDDDDMPEMFTGVNQETGDLEEIRFDELPEWKNNE